MKKISIRDALFVVVGVAFLVFVGFSMNLSKNAGKKVAEEFYVNAKGQKWTLPDEPVFEFTASSGSYPKFLSGKIEPVKVKVGDVQKFTIRVASPVLITSVKAITETDTKTQELTLQLVESKALSGNYFRNQPYLINEKNELIINNTNTNYAEKAIEQIITKAEAQALVEYVYAGEWVVNDTHTKTYHTAFLAVTENGDENKMMLAWSDPNCGFDQSGYLLNSCVFAGGIEGFDGGSLTIPAGKTITVSGDSQGDGGVLAWNSGSSLVISPQSTLIIEKGGVVQQADLYFAQDEDGDLWPNDIEFVLGGAVRVKDSPARPWAVEGGVADCNDGNSNVFPNNPMYYREQSGSGPDGWDYDCVEETTGGFAVGENAEPTTDIVATTIHGTNYLEPETCQHYPDREFNIDDCGRSVGQLEDCKPLGISKAAPTRQTTFLKKKSFTESLLSLFVKEAKALPEWNNGWFSDERCQTCLSGEGPVPLTFLCH